MPDSKDPRQPSRLVTGEYLDRRYGRANDFIQSPTMGSPTSVFTSPNRHYPDDLQNAPSEAQPGRQPQEPAADPVPQYTQGTGTVAQGTAPRPPLRHKRGSVGDHGAPIADRSTQPTSPYTTSDTTVRSSTTGGSYSERVAALKKSGRKQ